MTKSPINSAIGTSAITKKSMGSAQEDSQTSKNSSSDKEKTKTSMTLTLDDVFEGNLKAMYNAEQQLIQAIPEMAKAADSEDLQEVLIQHLEQTKRQAERLEKIFIRLKLEKEDQHKCEAMEALINEGKKIIEKFEEGPVRDAALIIAAQKIEHHEIAAYGSLCELADVLDYYKVFDTLNRSLEEEKEADEVLTEVAQEINDEAAEMVEEEYDSM